LDIRTEALKPGRSGARAIVPGKPAESELIRRVTCEDATEVMPPPKAKKPLSARQIEVLRGWIADGAAYEGHWAFLPPRRPAVPKGVSAIDHLVGVGWAARGLKAASPAPPEIVCRRIHLDLIGLPPTPARVAAFVEETKKDRDAAVARLIDELL